ncbi:MAG TPA: hypothetical protein VFB21_13525 [Chthonomonadaceae bacterium]|nr:hypothetical protein [Chthonomonadaceae bacterium]
MNKRKRIGMALLALVGVAGALLLFFYLRRQNLLYRATPIVETQQWLQQYGGYFWESDRSILSFRSAGRGGLQAFRVNVATGSARPLMTLNRRLRGAASSPAQWRLSPDGRWLVWQNLRSPGACWTASTLDGLQNVTWPIPRPTGGPSTFMGTMNTSGPLWLSDNRRWVEFVPNQAGVQPWMHRLDGKSVRGPRITGPLPWPMGVNAQDRVVSLNFRRGATLTINEYGLTPGAAPPRAFTVRLPGGMQTESEAELSPQGDRLAYILRTASASPLQRLLTWLVPPADNRAYYRDTLWVSRADGSEMRKLGEEGGGTLTGLMWMPNGRRISFFCQDKLYTLPVD